MQIRLTTNSGVPIYQQIVGQIKYLVAAGRLQPGEQLPPVRKLAEQILVNPNTVARAYRELESARVVVSKRGSGVFISDQASPLAPNEQTRILHEHIDALLAEAHQLDVSLDALLSMLQERSSLLRESHDSSDSSDSSSPESQS